MRWFTDDWEERYAELLYDLSDDEEEQEEDDESAMYFDVPHPYRPIQNNTGGKR